MPSRADSRTANPAPAAPWAEGMLRTAGAALHAAAFVAMALLLWRFITPDRARRDVVRVGISGRLDASLSALMRSASDTIDVQMQSAPDARARAALRALRGSGRVVQLTSDRVLNPVAVSAEEEWRAIGGTRVQMVGADSSAVVIKAQQHRSREMNRDDVRCASSAIAAFSSPFPGGAANSQPMMAKRVCAHLS